MAVVDRCSGDGERRSGRATRLIVDLDAIAGNVAFFRRLVSPGTGIVAVVKADGYGHGAIPVSRAALDAGASHLAVATVDEGLALRRAGIEAPVMLLGPIDPSEVGLALEGRLILPVTNRRFAELVRRIAVGLGGSPVDVQIKVDTGMHRFGATPGEAISLATEIERDPSLTLGGIYTHFADADGCDEANTDGQARIFGSVLDRLCALGIRPGLRHAANSAAALRWRQYDFDAVRIGIALYGLPPANEVPLPSELRPALRVVSRVAKVSELAAGEGVSYGLTYRTDEPEVTVLVPIGYADGLPRALSNRGWMGVAGRRAPIRGRVCMDQTVVGVPPGVRVRVGDPIEVMGGGGPSLAEVASLAGTIAYEIAVGLGRRAPRDYVRNGQPVEP
jgi:alanine racemase